MKDAIHPELKTARVTCVCGNTWETRSTIGAIHLDICSACHPFFTGKQKLVDAEGRVEKFMKKYANLDKSKMGSKKAAGTAQAAAKPK